MEKLLNLNIKEIFKLLATETVSTQVLLETTLKQIEKASKFNAFITLTQNEAEKASKKATERYKNKAPKSEIDGLPIALKDNFCTDKIRTTCASKMLENFVPTYDATVYQKLKDAGALLVGKTNMDQFAMGSGTVDGIFGPCKNPYGFENNDKWRISGGSSGGSAVAVATGSCFAAIGSDTGGSTRNPASYCGLVGLKPTYGLVSRHGLIPLVNSMDVPGILTKSVDDCASILNIVAGHDCKDSTSLTRPYRKIRLPPAGKMSLKNLKIGIPKEYHCEQLCPEILEIWNDIALLLQENGAIIKQVSLPHTEFSIVCYSILNQCEVASNMAKYDGIEFGFRANENDSTEKLFASTRSLGFNEVVRNRILTGNYFLLKRNYQKYFEQALKVRRLISNDFDLAWENVQILLTPTTLTEAPFYNDFVQKTNRDQCALQDYCTQPANMAGIPAISIPIKLSKSGLPLSLQLMGRNLSEPMLLAVAKFIENAVEFRKNQKMFDQP